MVTLETGNQFIAGAFQANAALFHIATKAVPVECPNSMTFVERYHIPLRRAFSTMKREASDLDYERMF